MTRRRVPGLTVLTLTGLLLVLGSRLVDPFAPPLYEGILTGAPPYAYCTPPQQLASSNKTPTTGSDTITFTAAANGFKTVETGDKQVLAYFPAHSVPVPAAASTLRVDIVPLSVPPPAPPANSRFVGEAYLIAPGGSEPFPLPRACDAAPTTVPGLPLLMAAQVLLRVPPVSYNNVRMFYDGAWHPLTWGAQQDFANVAIDHFGVIAAFNDAGKAPARPGGTFPVGLLEVFLTVGALLVIVGGVVVSRVQAGRGGN